MPPYPLLESLLDDPNLPEILQQAQSAWQAEQVRRAKFLNDITPEDKWEFINGEIVMHSPALQRHLVATGNLYQMLFIFAKNQKCGRVFVEKALTSFPRNDYEPDVIYFGEEKAASFQPTTLRFPIPDLIIEILSPSTEKRDRGVKFCDYQAHGVSEYWIVDTEDETVEIYKLDPTKQTYPPAEKQGCGYLESTLLAGFRIPVAAVFDEDIAVGILRGMNADEPTLMALRGTLHEEAQRRQMAELALEEASQALEEASQALEAKSLALEAKSRALDEASQALDEERLVRETSAQALAAERLARETSEQAFNEALAAEKLARAAVEREFLELKQRLNS